LNGKRGGEGFGIGSYSEITGNVGVRGNQGF